MIYLLSLLDHTQKKLNLLNHSLTLFSAFCTLNRKKGHLFIVKNTYQIITETLIKFQPSSYHQNNPSCYELKSKSNFSFLLFNTSPGTTLIPSPRTKQNCHMNSEIVMKREGKLSDFFFCWEKRKNVKRYISKELLKWYPFHSVKNMIQSRRSCRARNVSTLSYILVPTYRVFRVAHVIFFAPFMEIGFNV